MIIGCLYYHSFRFRIENKSKGSINQSILVDNNIQPLFLISSDDILVLFFSGIVLELRRELKVSHPTWLPFGSKLSLLGFVLEFTCGPC